MKFVLASSNPHKAQEIKAILGDGFQILTQAEADAKDVEIIEDGDSFRANAAKKAIAIQAFTGLPVIADDSGLCVDALGGGPGIYTARYAGEDATSEDNIKKLLSELKDVPTPERGARFVCVIAVAFPGEEIQYFEGVCEGRITTEKQGESGFGYDPVFYVPAYARTMAQLEPHIKNVISHRGRALRAMTQALHERG